ncbi:MAG TPA: hypothetical protein VMI94_28650 [Bryobacteraceae bacterium]|nr:hypothetical protein [Bryobacteraceae bacterium]
MNRPLLAIALMAVAACAQPQSLHIGFIDFYGYAGIDLDAIRARLPIHEGDQVTEDQMEKLIDRIKHTADATGVNAVCCDDQRRLMFYIGLRGRSARDVPYNPVPHGDARLPATVTELDRQFVAAVTAAVSAGRSAEDQSKGYALSADPAARSKQMAMRRYAVGHERLIQRVLQSSGDADHRAIAARLMGYARQSREQIGALVQASHDPDEEVRNNATRALWVLAASGSKPASWIPAAGFIEMLYSRSWTDRNKSLILLEVLTRGRDPKLLSALRAQALPPLLEMARWHNFGHAGGARMILGRCAGIEEHRLEKLASAGEVDVILAALQARPGR